MVDLVTKSSTKGESRMESKPEKVVDVPMFMNFQVFQKIFGVKVVSIGLECPVCKRIWGFKVKDERTIEDVRQHNMICFYCESLKENDKLSKTIEE